MSQFEVLVLQDLLTIGLRTDFVSDDSDIVLNSLIVQQSHRCAARIRSQQFTPPTDSSFRLVGFLEDCEVSGCAGQGGLTHHRSALSPLARATLILALCGSTLELLSLWVSSWMKVAPFLAASCPSCPFLALSWLALSGTWLPIVYTLIH